MKGETILKAIWDNDTIQIEVTNHCVRQCANCSRHVGHHQEPFFMDFEFFKQCVDSLVGTKCMIGLQGGETLLHPDFEKMCEYASSKFPKEQLGLWTTFPKGFEKYREIICNTFYHIFLNDHTRDDIYHHPGLVAIEEIIKHRKLMWAVIDKCWAQQCWSASINPNGAFFCEIAAALSILFNKGKGWKVEPEWWFRTPKDFTEQIEEFCPKCGFAINISRRISTDDIDDISPLNYELLKDTSPKIKSGKYKIHNLQTTQELEPLASYKDMEYRTRIANRYGIFLILNEYNFLTPYLRKNF